MSLDVQSVNGVNRAAASRLNAVQNTSKADQVCFKGNEPLEQDVFQSSAKQAVPENDKKEILGAAKSNAAGWSIFGGPISTLYYGLRSDETIAQKYNLDPQADKDFIKEIRKEQVLWTLPSLVGFGLPAWIVSKCI